MSRNSKNWQGMAFSRRRCQQKALQRECWARPSAARWAAAISSPMGPARPQNLPRGTILVGPASPQVARAALLLFRWKSWPCEGFCCLTISSKMPNFFSIFCLYIILAKARENDTYVSSMKEWVVLRCLLLSSKIRRSRNMYSSYPSCFPSVVFARSLLVYTSRYVLLMSSFNVSCMLCYVCCVMCTMLFYKSFSTTSFFW